MAEPLVVEDSSVNFLGLLAKEEKKIKLIQFKTNPQKIFLTLT